MKWIAAVILIAASALALASLWRLGDPSRAFDFSTFYAAGMLATTENAPAVFDRMPGDLSKTPPEGALARAAADAGYPAVPGQYFNLPVVMLLYKPLTAFNFATAYRIVVIANLVALIALAWLIVRLTASSLLKPAGETRATRSVEQDALSVAPASSRCRGHRTPAAILISATAMLSVLASVSHPVRYNVELGNISVLLTLAVIAAYVFDRVRLGIVGGVILGLTIIIKPAPALLLLYFIVRRRWIITLSTTATMMALLTAGLVYYGPDMHFRWLEIIRWNGSHTFVAWNNQSMLASMLRFAVQTFEIAAWDVHAAPPWIVWALRGLVFAGVAWWCAAVFRRRRSAHDDASFAAGTILMTVALPFAWTHYYVVLLWPTAIVAARLLANRRRGALDWTLLAIVVMAWIASPLTTFELAQRWRTAPLIGSVTPRLLVSHVLAAAIVLFIWLLRRPSPASATPSPAGTRAK